MPKSGESRKQTHSCDFQIKAYNKTLINILRFFKHKHDTIRPIILVNLIVNLSMAIHVNQKMSSRCFLT